jgi:hypothetical protein
MQTHRLRSLNPVGEPPGTGQPGKGNRTAGPDRWSASMIYSRVGAARPARRGGTGARTGLATNFHPIFQPVPAL